MFQAKKKCDLHILNYTVTSNHIHLLIYDEGRRNVIPRSILLTAGRAAREYNQRKNRSGAFWEVHYHATAVDTGKHLNQCMVYIDLNMVRVGVVKHPTLKKITSKFTLNGDCIILSYILLNIIK